ncbi:selenocysteine-specific translation elongation factor [Gordonia hydrophobica]|uniref:Selenocysteine-specific elongation factor n=1 Tax=Gordonia hydrophobica TaxID=40516 RepID=A0ABZ2TXI9_9ACTN|nr:selenocysteine-specific translation elongation factor [Gordonia hydrophobica]MBM7366404.1 selenocysteine-specific elongation factor [Gordonia hydrophobica]
MFVIATAGHVDHGKSTLVKALTGMEPDRWEQERRRGLTIDLGFVWTVLPSGCEVGFVDVPGHERFLPNMLAGLGPAPAVCFVVAADEGWRQQSSDHRDALAAWGIEHGVVVISRADRATDARVAEVIDQVRTELADTGIADAPIVVTSAVAGTGLAELRSTLDRLVADATVGGPGSDGADRVRLWIDRAFAITGAGTVVTGTLAAGAITVGDRLRLAGRNRRFEVTVRGLQSHGRDTERALPVSRVAVNLRGVAHDEIHRGDVLLDTGPWPQTRVVDVRRTTGDSDVPAWLTAHVGTASVPVRARSLDEGHLRLTLSRELPLRRHDRLVLRDPGAGRIVGGAQVLDVDPPPLVRRGDGVRRGQALAGLDDAVAAEVRRRGAITRGRLAELGWPTQQVPDDVDVIGDWWVASQTLHEWQARLRGAVVDLHESDPLSAGLTDGAAHGLLALPDPALLARVVDGAGVVAERGLLFLPEHRGDLGPAESAVAELERRLTATPFVAPEADDLVALALGVRELAAAERAGRLLRLADGLVVLPETPALAMRELAQLPQPFTTSQARQALDTSRRVAIPLLEHLDGRGWTRRIDAGHREVAR